MQSLLFRQRPTIYTSSGLKKPPEKNAGARSEYLSETTMALLIARSSGRPDPCTVIFCGHKKKKKKKEKYVLRIVVRKMLRLFTV